MKKDQKTTITVNVSTWKQLVKRKNLPNETIDDIIKRLLLEFPEVKRKSI